MCIYIYIDAFPFHPSIHPSVRPSIHPSIHPSMQACMHMHLHHCFYPIVDTWTCICTQIVR